MITERIVDQITSKQPKTSREQILERLERERKKTGGLIADETLLRIIAAEFDVEIQGDDTFAPGLSIIDLIPNLNNVSVVGRVVAVFPTRTFNGRRSGKIASLIIVDQSDILRIVFWNDKTSLIESDRVKIGQIIRFSHGYTKEGRSGKIELHVGEKCEIEIDPQDVNANEYPTISGFMTKVGDVGSEHRNKKVNIAGTVKELLSTSTFERSDSTYGKVMRLILEDASGEATVVAWNSKVDELEGRLKKGSRLQVVDAKVKNAMHEGFEIHVDAETYVEASSPDERFLKIAGLKENVGYVDVDGEVATKPMLKEVKTAKGEFVQLATFELKDETGRIWVSAWRKHANIAGNLKMSDKIIIKDAYVKKGFGDQLELSTREATSILRK